MVSKKEPQFIIKLQSNPSTGYSWFLQDYNQSIVQPLKHTYESGDKTLMGAGGVEIWTFKIKPEGLIVPQQTSLHFLYARPWSEENTKEVIFQISTNNE
jgi:predicted secreted protein